MLFRSVDLYIGGLIGLEKHARQNIITIFFTLLRSGGVLLLFKFIKPDIEAFFIWQAAIFLLYIVILRVSLYRSICINKYKPKFSKQYLKSVWKFTSGMTGIGIVTFFLTQTDKIIVSKMLPLSVFAFYTLAFTIANGMTLATAPFGTTIFPRFSSLIALDKKTELIKLYNKTCKMIAYILFPIGLMVICFTKDVIYAWTHDNNIVIGSSNLALLLTIGSICNCLMLIPYQLLLAHGNTRFTFYQNLIAAIFIVPLLIFSIKQYGSTGATFGWLFVNACYVIITIPLIHKMLKLGSIYKWYLDIIIIPTVKSLTVLLSCRYIIKNILHVDIIPLWMLFIMGIVVFLLPAITIKEYRERLLTYTNKLSGNA